VSHGVHRIDSAPLAGERKDDVHVKGLLSYQCLACRNMSITLSSKSSSGNDGDEYHACDQFKFVSGVCWVLTRLNRGYMRCSGWTSFFRLRCSSKHMADNGEIVAVGEGFPRIGVTSGLCDRAIGFLLSR
jgi:hypothetical protein